MQIIKNKKGTILIATYIVLCVIIVVASSYFTLSIKNNQAVMKETEGIKALSNAERGLAYAFCEAYNSGWSWYTHNWNTDKSKLLPIPTEERLITRPDCFFNTDGFYEHASGDFMVKAYPDTERENDTIVLCKGKYGKEERVLMFYLSRQGIYDFFLFSPYDLNLVSAVGTHPRLKGGGIHSNGNIYLDYYSRLEDISELSTGADGSIYYTSSQYLAPYYADQIDGVMDGKAPITSLSNLSDVGRDDRIPEAGPFGYYDSDMFWHWKVWGTTYFVRDCMDCWPTRSFTSTEEHFRGNSQDRYNVPDGQSSGGVINDSGGDLNRYNVWIKPYRQDDEGNQIKTNWTEIPAELNEEWAWSKYYGDDLGSGSAASEVPIEFYLYNDDGSIIDVNKTYWEIKGKKVERLDPPAPGDTKAWDKFLIKHPDAKQYWDMFRSSEFWDTVRGDSLLSEVINPEIADGFYGNDRSGGGKTLVKNTNSKKQPNAWSQFLANADLEDIVQDGNTGGQYLQPPDFDATYTTLAKKDGLYISVVDPQSKPATLEQWQHKMEASIDAAVEDINTRAQSDSVARKVKFINTFTQEWTTVLELDLEAMQTYNVQPNNGVLYSEVPIRLVNASRLPRTKPKYGFTVLGEENVYLKGDYNTKEKVGEFKTDTDWVTSAVITKKRIFTLSDDFNDPQVVPATEHYPDYPYIFIKYNGTDFEEVPQGTDGGFWVHSSYLDSDGSSDEIDYYPDITDANEAKLRETIENKDADYRSVFNVDDASGTMTATWSWVPTGETLTQGMMPNKVHQDHTYNCLMASNRWLDANQSNRGDILENWRYCQGESSYNFYRNFNGAFFVLEDEGFTAANDEFVDYRDISIKNRGYSNTFWDADFLYRYWAPTNIAYDQDFRTRTRSPSDVFFGGAQSIWMEASVDLFNKMDF